MFYVIPYIYDRYKLIYWYIKVHKHNYMQDNNLTDKIF